MVHLPTRIEALGRDGIGRVNVEYGFQIFCMLRYQCEAIALREKLVATGNDCELHIVPGGGHNFGDDAPEWREKSRELMIEFLSKQGLINR